MEAVQPTLLGETFNPLNVWLGDRFPEVEPWTFYRELFPAGELERQGELAPGKYRGVAVRVRDGKARRFSISDGLEVLSEAAQATQSDFWLSSPVSYAGRSQRQEMARWLYAVAVDLDGIRIENPEAPRGLEAMWNQISHGIIQPRPTFIVSSGTGLHMYYFLNQPLAMYRNVIRQLQRFRHNFIRRVWSSFVTELWKKPQYESVTQGFRMVGTYTKKGDLVRAYRTGSRMDFDYLNEWVDEENRVTDIHYKSELTLAEAREKYPDWYQKRIVEGKPRGSWTPKRDLYDWWKRKIGEAGEGHRYFYLMCLAIYAMKCNISEDELRADAWSLAPTLKTLDRAGNHLTDSDIEKALQMYNTDYQTFPRRSIEALTAIPIPANKRNYRKQPQHLEIARFVRDLNQREKNTDWRYHGGAPSKRDQVRAWREAHPDGRKIDCERETGISRPTILKWWNG